MASVDLDINVEIGDTVKALKNLTKALDKSLGNVEKEAKEAARGIDKSLGGSFKSLRKSALNSVKGINKGIGGLTDSIFSIKGAVAGIAGVLAFRELARGISAVTEAASIQEDAINQLNIALKASGQFSEETSKDFQEFASSLQEVTTFGDEVLLQNAALIQSLGQLDSDGLKKATVAAADLSAALGISLNSAATLVGKAAAGNIESFSRYGLIIEKGATSNESFANTLEAINNQFGGAAEGQVFTFSGALDQLSNAFGDVQEVVGQFITSNPAVISGINTLSKLFVQLQDVLKANSDQGSDLIGNFIEGLLNAIPAAINVVADLVDAIGLISTSISPVVRAFDFLADKVGTALALMVQNLITFASTIKTAILAPVNLAIQGLNKLGAVSDETAQSFSNTFNAALEDTKFNLAASAAGFEDLFTTVNDDTTSQFFTDLTKGSISAADSIRNIGTTAENVIKGTFSKDIKVSPEIQVDQKQVKESADKASLSIEEALKIADLQIELQKVGASAEEIARIEIDKKVRDQVLEVNKLITDGKLNAEQGQQFINDIVANGAQQRAAIEEQESQARLANIKEFFSSIGNVVSQALGAVAGVGGAALGGVAGTATSTAIDENLQNELKAISDALVAGEISQAQAAEKRFEAERSAQLELGKISEDNLQTAGDALGGVVGQIGNLVPGLGGVLGGLFDVLSAPPDALGKQIEGFISAIPAFISRIAENLPTIISGLAEGLISTLVDAIPQLISQLADIVPGLLIALVDAITDPAFIDSLIAAVFKFVTAIIDALPTIITALVNAIPTIIKAIARELPGIIVALVRAIPQIINALILAIPDIIVALVEAIPIIITGLIDALPELFPELINGAIEALPQIIGAFITLIPRIIVALARGIFGIFQSLGGAVTNIFKQGIGDAVSDFGNGIAESVKSFGSTLLEGASEFVTKFLEIPGQFITGLINDLKDGISKVFEGLNPFGGGGGGGGVGGITDSISLFAKGIDEVPPGFPKDNFLAGLTSGERVVPSNTNQDLKAFLANQNSGGSSRTDALLAEIATLLEQPMTVQTSAEVNGQTLADIILELSRNNARLTA